jgi:putative peptidoglycan lipid II flippase
MIKKLFNSQTKTITMAAVLLFFSGLASKFLAFIRDRLLAGTFGAGEELDIYFAAFRIPDFIYGILILGGISAVFLPVFSEHFQKDKEKGWQLASNVLNCFLVLLIFVCSLLAVFTPFLIKFIVPGFEGESRELAIVLTRIMFLSPVLFGISSIFSGILHYFNRFLIYSLAPVLYNAGIIAGIIFFFPIFGLKGLAFGVILGALLHLLIQIPPAKAAGFKYGKIFDFKSPGLVKIFRLMVPRTIGTAAYHLNLIVITAVASTLAAGSITVFNLAHNLSYAPIGLVGTSFAIASFPVLSKNWAAGLKEKFSSNFFGTFRHILFLIIPASVLIFLLRAQIVRIILGTGKFSWDDTRLTAACLGVFCLGIFALSCIPFLSRVFYSLYNTRTPVKIGIFSVLLNIGLAFSLINVLSSANFFRSFLVNLLKLQGIGQIQVIALPLALSLAAIVQFFLLLFFLKREIKEIRFKDIFDYFKKIFLTSLIMGIFVYFSLQLLAGLVDMQTFLGVLIQGFLAFLIGFFVYVFFARMIGLRELKTIESLILGKLKKNGKL